MKFVTDRIPFSSGKSFAEIVKEHLEKKAKKEEGMVKTAAVEEKPVVIEEKKEEIKVAKDKEAPSSGQPQAEAKLVNIPDKEAPSKGSTCKKEEAPSSGQPEAEGKLTNDPKVQSETKEEVKEAASVCEECKKPKNLCVCKKEEKKDAETKKVEEVKVAEETKLIEETKEVKVEKQEEKKAKTEAKFVRIANLDPKSKAWLKEYWKKLYPADYVDAMLADK